MRDSGPGEGGGEGSPRPQPFPQAGWVRRVAARLRGARWVWAPLAAFALSRLAILLAAWLGLALLPPDPAIQPYHIRPESFLLDLLGSRWDTGFYLSIATEGYVYQGAELPSVAFFPLLPLAMGLAMPLVGGDALLAGILVSNLALAGAGMLLYRLVALEGDEAVAGRAVWYLMLFPVSFFGSAIYTESLFLFCAVGALYAARRGIWESAGLLGIGAALSRLMGILVAPLLLVEWGMQRRAKAPEDRPPRWAALAGLAVPLGTLAYMAFLARRFGDPLAFAAGSAAWGREPRPVWAMLGMLVQTPPGGWLAGLAAETLPLNDWIDALAAAAFLALGLVLLRQRRWSEAVFVILGVLIPLNSGLWMSQRRYVWVLFPAFMLLARWGERPWLNRAITLLFALGLALFSALFAAWHWVA